MYRRPIILASLALATLVSAAQAQTVTLRYGQIANSARGYSSLGLYVAQRKGFLAREGIELKVVRLPGLHTMVEAVDKDEVELAHTATPFLVQAALKGSTAVAVVGAPGNAIHTLVARPEIKSIADIKGKVVGLSTPQDTLSIGARLLLAKHGLKQGDYEVREMQGTTMRLECMTKGPCVAAPLTQPEDVLAVQRGFNKLGDSLEVLPALQFSVIVAKRSWAAANKDTLVRFARAFADSYRFIHDRARRDEIVAIMGETMDTPPPVANAMLTLYLDPDRGVMPKQAEISSVGIDNVIKLIGSVGELQPPFPDAERFIDRQYLRAAGVP